jgi:hypothetical protein
MELLGLGFPGMGRRSPGIRRGNEFAADLSGNGLPPAGQAGWLSDDGTGTELRGTGPAAGTELAARSGASRGAGLANGSTRPFFPIRSPWAGECQPPVAQWNTPHMQFQQKDRIVTGC